MLHFFNQKKYSTKTINTDCYADFFCESERNSIIYLINNGERFQNIKNVCEHLIPLHIYAQRISETNLINPLLGGKPHLINKGI